MEIIFLKDSAHKIRYISLEMMAKNNYHFSYLLSARDYQIAIRNFEMYVRFTALGETKK